MIVKNILCKLIKFVTRERRRNYLLSESNFYTTKLFTWDLAIEMKKEKKKKTWKLINKPVYLGRSVLALSKILMYEFWHDYVKPKYGENEKLCYMDTDSFIIDEKTNDIYKKISEDVETRFDTSNFESERPLIKGKNKKVIGLIKDGVGGKIKTKFVGPRAKT